MKNNKILQKLYTQDQETLFSDIISTYQKQWYCTVNYLYFAVMIMNNLFDEGKENKLFQSMVMDGDFLLPDGIALQCIYRKNFWKQLPNLNWTDFAPFFLNKLKEQWIKFNLILYWGLKSYKDKVLDYIKTNFDLQPQIYIDWYSQFDFSLLDKHKWQNNIILLWLGQKVWVWVEENMDKIKEYNLLVFNQWGTFDFWGWYEKRAPKILRTLKAEWIRRLLVNPKKNFQKFMISLKFFRYILK